MKTKLEETIHYRVKPLRIPVRPWRKFLGHLPADHQWTMLIYGPSYGGKSSFAAELAGLFSDFGPVLYINHEEGLKGGTIQTKFRRLGIKSKRFPIYFMNARSSEELDQELGSGEHKYVIIDSLSSMAHKRAEIYDIISLEEKYPEISFIYILHFDKRDITYIGPTDLKHNRDIALKVDNKIVYTDKNRYKNGDSNTMFDIFRKKIHEEKIQKPQQKSQKGRFRFNGKKRKTIS